MEKSISIIVKNVEMSSFIALLSGIPNHSPTIICIGVQWNHPDLSGCTPGVGVLAISYAVPILAQLS